MIIGLSGAMGSGKDQTWQYIEEWASTQDIPACRDAFADRLKESAARCLGLPFSGVAALIWCNTLKTKGSISVTCGEHEFTISGREYLQYFGTEGHRQVFDNDFWINACLPLDGHYPEEDILVITDVRFPNEADRIHELGGEVWNVVRSLGQARDAHISEQPLPDEAIDLTLLNQGDLLDLRNSVFNLMETKVPA